MGTSDDFFSAVTDSDAVPFAFENQSGRHNLPGELPPYQFGVVGYGSAGGVVGCGGPAMTRLLGPYSTFAGVHGTASDFTGVAGTSVNRVGVYGQVEDNAPVSDGLHAGVLGAATTQPGVVGFSADGDGVLGATNTGVGVRGVSYFGTGVQGESDREPGVTGLSNGTSGVKGVGGQEGPPPGMNIGRFHSGVLGTGFEGPGVIGTSNAHYGVYGFSTRGAAVVGEAGPAAFAGVFNGKVAVNGVFTAAVKNAAVPFPDGTQRLLHCMESPEHWFEDFGAARLKRGRAMVKLDADFAKVIKRGDYKVFFTPEGDCKGLCVRKHSDSFEVRELQGGTSGVAFSYRIVGRRKDIRAHRRFAKVDSLPTPAPAPRRPSRTKRAFIAELERLARAKATPAMRKSDRKVAALPPADLQPHRPRRARRASRLKTAPNAAKSR